MFPSLGFITPHKHAMPQVVVPSDTHNMYMSDWKSWRPTDQVGSSCMTASVRPLVKSAYQKINLEFSTKMYVVGTQKKHLIETVLLGTKTLCLYWWVRKYWQFYTQKFCLYIKTYEHSIREIDSLPLLTVLLKQVFYLLLIGHFNVCLYTPFRRQLKTPILLRNVDQKSIETVFSIAICRHTGDKWQ